MKTKDLVTVIVALIVVFWLGNLALGLLHHVIHLAVRLVILVAAAVVIVYLVNSRRG